VSCREADCRAGVRLSQTSTARGARVVSRRMREQRLAGEARRDDAA